MNRKWHITNAIILFCLIIMPMVVLASVPTTTSFDRHNEYVMDGFRDGGYYAVRDNPAITGYMNMSHIGGTNIFNITTYNIANITLDLDLMYAQRSSLFGWGVVSWEDAVASLGEEITININSDDGLDELRFVDHPEVQIQVLKDGLVYQAYGNLQDVEIEVNPLDAGQTQIILQFDFADSLFDLVYSMLLILIVVGFVSLIIRFIQRAMFYDGSYYKKWSGN